jgi:hypothetical protein
MPKILYSLSKVNKIQFEGDDLYFGTFDECIDIFCKIILFSVVKFNDLATRGAWNLSKSDILQKIYDNASNTVYHNYYPSTIDKRKIFYINESVHAKKESLIHLEFKFEHGNGTILYFSTYLIKKEDLLMVNVSFDNSFLRLKSSEADLKKLIDTQYLKEFPLKVPKVIEKRYIPSQKETIEIKKEFQSPSILLNNNEYSFLMNADEAYKKTNMEMRIETLKDINEQIIKHIQEKKYELIYESLFYDNDFNDFILQVLNDKGYKTELETSLNHCRYSISWALHKNKKENNNVKQVDEDDDYSEEEEEDDESEEEEIPLAFDE